MKRFLNKTIRRVLIGFFALLVFVLLLPELFPGFVSKKIKQWTNQAITSKVDFSKARLSFIKHFPSLTLSLYNCTLSGSAPFKNDTLLQAKELALGINLSTLFSKTIGIDKIFVVEGSVNILVNKEGLPNYNIYHAPNTEKKYQTADTGSASLSIEKIVREREI
jgi:AsmA protein